MTFNTDLQALYSYLDSQNIKIDKEEFKFQLEIHANYPSLLSFADALSFFDIRNIVIKLPLEEIDNLENSFVTLLQKENLPPALHHITKEGDFYLLKENNIQKLSKEELKNLWLGIVLLVEAPEEYHKKSNSKIYKTAIMTAFAVIFLGLVYYFSSSLSFVLFSLLSLIGLFLSIEALKTELGIESKISQSFCNAIPNADCGQVINSTKNKWLQKVKISDISFWFFMSQLLAIFIFSVTQFSYHFFNIMIISLSLSVPMTLYSIYFQYRIEKKWCPICLTIIGIVYIEIAFLLYQNNNDQLSIYSIVLFTSIFLIIAGLVYLLKPIFLEKKDLNEKFIKQLRFSRNYEVFKNTLLKSENQFLKKEYIVIGNKESKQRISIITSPLCGYCKDAHNLLDKIFNRFGNNIGISIRFNYYEQYDSKIKNLHIKLGEIYENKGDSEFMFALKNWFENKNIDKWLAKFGNPEKKSDTEKKLKEIHSENVEKGLNFTPNIFLNQYNYPNQFDRENLEYFIADWIEDEEL